jgi:peptidoglycan/xylan/chitin deacetylase (PgdA/CDA1 family)
MRNIDRVARIEEELGLRSSWNLVPYKYPIDQGLVGDLVARGFEIGVHGYNHDGLLFASRRIFFGRLPAICEAISRYSADGFRAPMVHRNLEWLQELPLNYDASFFDVDPFQAMPGGIGSLWPLIIGEMVELPYTLPQDHTLFVSLGETSDIIWRKKWEVIRAWSGMGLMLTHPDYLDSPARLDVYRGFLDFVLEQNEHWHALPRDVASWWRQRDQVVRSNGHGERRRTDGGFNWTTLGNLLPESACGPA